MGIRGESTAEPCIPAWPGLKRGESIINIVEHSYIPYSRAAHHAYELFWPAKARPTFSVAHAGAVGSFIAFTDRPLRASIIAATAFSLARACVLRLVLV